MNILNQFIFIKFFTFHLQKNYWKYRLSYYETASLKPWTYCWDCITTQKVSFFEVFLVPVFPYLDWIYTVNLRIQFKCGKIRTKKTPNMDTFNTVYNTSIVKLSYWRNYCSLSFDKKIIFIWFIIMKIFDSMGKKKFHGTYIFPPKDLMPVLVSVNYSII